MAKTILLADDSATIRKIVELTFASTDIRVVAVGNGREAMERWHAMRPDLVIADVFMPELSGYEVCRAVKGSARPVPVVLLAGAFEPFDRELADDCGADDHLIKPFEASTLRMRVERMLAAPAAGRPALEASEPQRAEAEGALADLVGEGGEVPRPAPAVRPVAAPGREGAAAPGGAAPAGPAPELVEQLARAVVAHLAADVVREIAREVVPEVAARIVRERIRELEDEAE